MSLVERGRAALDQPVREVFPAFDGARPIVFHTRNATCMHPYVKGVTLMVNSIYNGWRWEDLWLDR